MLTVKDSNTFPFTSEQLEQFKNELHQAGSLDALMYKKEAIENNQGMKLIKIYKDIEGYKTKYLTGAYEPLRSMYDKEMPYIFWSDMYEVLLRDNEESI